MSSPDLSHIDLARDFSPTPLGRYRRQGKFSGEAFREDFLRDRLGKFEQITVDLDGASGLSSGFLDEAFAGLVRDGTLTEADFSRRIHIIATKDALLLTELESYVQRASLELTRH